MTLSAVELAQTRSESARDRVGEALPSVTDSEAREYLSSMLDLCEQESGALDAMRDDRLNGVLHVTNTLRAELVAALAALTRDKGNGIKCVTGDHAR
jgi:cation transport ATPase